MEFAWSPVQDAFRASIRDFISANLPDGYDALIREGLGTGPRTVMGKQFSQKLAEQEMLVRHWPVEYGGGGDDDWWNYFIQTEENWAAWEPRGPQYMNTSWIGPSIMRFGTEAIKQAHLPAIREGTVAWCQGFSEPHGGTDLAAMRTSAEPVEGGYRINGSKIWTSYSPSADYIFLLARTGKGRKDISCFLLPMDSPGILVRENPGVVPVGHLNEVFFSDVFAPVESMLGNEGEAWEIVKFVIAYERIGVPFYHMGSALLDHVVAQLQAQDRFDDSHVRAFAARVRAELEAARQISYSVMDERARGMPSSALAQLGRSSNVTSGRSLLDFLSEVLGPEIGDGDGTIESYYRFTLPNGHGAGAHEVVLNAIAQGMLDLPRG
ncbi:MAG: acyl-CoA dehydrogenase [Sphingomonadales bacterium]|nr:MAG: acyl-CoA dehydrogenase [Sphingomonadales bacterium]